MKPRMVNEIDRYAADRLKVARLMANLSQQDAGKLLGVSFQQIQKYERGMNRITLGKAVMICQAYGVPPGFLFEGAPGFNGNVKAVDDVGAKLIALPGGMAAAVAISRVPDAVRRSITALAESIACA